ncbi:MAG: DUF58 domain-containing protein [Fimbriimonadaceae bacterium]|nr:DUF58 domain-containing protein [Fimbriimonadaceae bacterium]
MIRESSVTRAANSSQRLVRRQEGLNRYAAITLTTAAFFLIVMAILVDSPPLFYMATAIVITLAGARLQARLAVRSLRVERTITPAVQVGEIVHVHLTLWSERRLKRPLLSVIDHLPSRLRPKDLTPSLPVAPSFDQPIQTKYSFKPTRRGRYRWDRVTVYGSDALGLVSQSKLYETAPAELTVYPSPLPVNIQFTPAGGWGMSELEAGSRSGSGLETKGIRNYVAGDPIKTIHWRSVARTGKLMVKEFESGSGLSMMMLLQQTRGTDFGDSETGTFEAMCGHCLYMAGHFIEKGALISIPQIEAPEAYREHPAIRERAIREALTDIMPDSVETLSQQVTKFRSRMNPGETLCLFITVQDPALPGLLAALPDIQKIALLYDAREYAEGHAAQSVARAVESAYIDELDRAGCQTFLLAREAHLA